MKYISINDGKMQVFAVPQNDPQPPGYAAIEKSVRSGLAYNAFITAGLTITSTETPAVNGTYACDDAQQDTITRLQTYIDKTPRSRPISRRCSCVAPVAA
jgi:hypothetical protein